MRGTSRGVVELPEGAAARLDLDAVHRHAVLHEAQLLEPLPGLERPDRPAADRRRAPRGGRRRRRRGGRPGSPRPGRAGGRCRGAPPWRSRARGPRGRRPRWWRRPGRGGGPRGSPRAPRRRSAAPASRPGGRGRPASPSISAATNQGGVSGASPWRLTTIVVARRRARGATAAQRSVPLRQVSGVIATSAPKRVGRRRRCAVVVGGDDHPVDAGHLRSRPPSCGGSGCAPRRSRRAARPAACRDSGSRRSAPG